MRRIVLAIVAIFLLVQTVFAEQMVSLRDAVTEALKNNPALKASKWQTVAKAKEAESTLRLYYPKLRFEERFLRTNNPTYAFMAKLNQQRFTLQDFQIQRLNEPDAQNDFQTSISIEQPVFVPKLFYGIKAANKVAEASEIEHERIKEQIVKETIKAYLMVQTAKAYVKAAEKGLEDAKENLRIATLMYDKGVGLLSDKLRATSAVKDAERRLALARKNLALAKRALGMLMGRKEPVDVNLERPRFQIQPMEVYEKLYLQRADIKALKKKAEAAKAALKMSKAAFLPELGIGGSYQFNDHNSPFGSEGDSYMIMAFLRWNIFDATLWSNKKKAEADLKSVENAINARILKARFDLERAFLDVKEKQKALELTKAELASAEEALRLVRARYKNSLSPFVDLLNTETVTVAARAKLVQAENDYYQAIVELYYQAGILLREFLKSSDSVH